MSLLSICQAVAEDCGFAAPSAIVGGSDDTAVQLLALANKGGQMLARKPWEALQGEHTFSTADGTASYAKPSDYGWFIDDTAWDRTDYWKLRGSLSPREWQLYKSGIVSASPRSRFRIKGGLIYIDPTPSSIRSVVIEYVSNEWASNAAGDTFATAFAADDDTVRGFDELVLQLDLTWRFLKAKGLAYAEDKAEAERQTDLLMARDVPSQPMSQAGDRRVIWPPMPTWSGSGLGS